MVQPADVPRVLLDAARLIGTGELAELEATMPYRGGRIVDPRRIAAFEAHLVDLKRMVVASKG